MNLEGIKAFDRLETGRAAFLVPIVLFLIGLGITVLACESLRRLDEAILRDTQPPQDDMVRLHHGTSHHVS